VGLGNPKSGTIRHHPVTVMLPPINKPAPPKTGFALGNFMRPATERDPLSKLHDEVELSGNKVEWLKGGDK
jgi:hypothetical protein